MRFWMAWLLVFGVITGTTLRAMAHEQGIGHHNCSEQGSTVSLPVDEGCCGTHEQEEESPAPCAPDCPDKHHHHHGHNCCVSVSVAVDPDKDPLIIPSGRTADVLRAAHDRIPGSPVFETDIPPLI